MSNSLEEFSLDPSIFILEVVATEKIVVINLDRRPDRWDAIRHARHPAVTERFVRFAATDGQALPIALVESYRWNRKLPIERAAGELGCRDSWFRAVAEHGPGLYFEDDAVPGAPWPFGEPPDSAEIVLPGGELWKRTREPGWTVAAPGANGSHALWIRTDRAAAELCSVWQPDGRHQGPVDLAWGPVLQARRAVVAVPQIVCQASPDTDVQFGRTFINGHSLIDPWCSLPGQPQPSGRRTFRPGRDERIP